MAVSYCKATVTLDFEDAKTSTNTATVDLFKKHNSKYNTKKIVKINLLQCNLMQST